MASRARIAVSTLILLAAASALVFASPTLAAEPASEMTVVVADGAGLSDLNSIDMARSVVALVATLSPARSVAFIDADRPSQVFGPLAPSDPGFDGFLADVEAELGSGSATEGGLFAAMAEAATVLGLERAEPGSSVLLLVGGEAARDFASLAARLTPLVDRMAEQGFRLRVVTTGGESEVDLFAARLASVAGGSVLSADSPRALPALARSLLSLDGGAGMNELGDSRLSEGEILSIGVDVAPGTTDVRLVVFKDDSHGSIRLIEPSGAEARPADAVSPHVVAWVVDQPKAGKWRLETGGLAGAVTVWSDQSNGIVLTLVSDGPVPIGEPVDLIARAIPTNAVADGTEMFAHVTSPDGKTLTYRLRDDGLAPDAAPADGYFSGSVAPLVESGVYEVVLELAWEDMNYRITSQHSIRSQPFPRLDVKRVVQGELNPGERTLVATASVRVDGQPYTVSPSDIRPEFSGTAEKSQVVDIVARDVSSAGGGWVFDVYVTINEPGNSALTLRLDVDYVGRPYVHTPESIVIGVSSPPSPAPEPIFEAPDVTPAEPQATFPWWVLTFPALLVAIMAWAGIRWLAATAPVGYLYDDRQVRMVDFAALQRGPLARLLNRDRISGRELGVPGLDGITFVFQSGRVSVRSAKPSTSVRVDSRPLSGEATLGRRNWIGAGGRAYNFQYAPPAGGAPE